MNILLDYLFPISSIIPAPAASTAFLKQVCLVVKPDGEQAEEPVVCTSMDEVAALTENEDAAELFNAGMSRVYILPIADLDLSDALDGHASDFFTVLISSDFDDEDITQVAATGGYEITDFAKLVSGENDAIVVAGVSFIAQPGAVTPGDETFRADTSNDDTAQSLVDQINSHSVVGDLVVASRAAAVITLTAKQLGLAGNDITTVYTDNDTNAGATVASATLEDGAGMSLGAFRGVTGVSSSDGDVLALQAAVENRCAFHVDGDNGAKNLCFAFGKLLSNAVNWLNQQYIAMPFSDDVDSLGEANANFDDKISFVMSDSEFGVRLGLFAAGHKAICAPYIVKNLEIDLQSAALSYISGNMPAYTKTDAALLEDSLEKVIKSYVSRQWIEAGVVAVTLEQSNFVASGNINIAEPKALWRIFGQMRQTL